MAGTFENLVGNVDGALSGFYAAASHGMSTFIMPVAWVVFAMSILVWGYLTIAGKTSGNVLEGGISMIFIVLILFLASGGYVSLIADPLANLPDQLAGAVAGTGGKPVDIIDSLFDKLCDMLSGIAKAIVQQGSDWNFGAAFVLGLVLMVVFVVSGLLLGGAIFVYLYAKIGLSLVLACGPFFVVWLAWQPTRQQFYPWLNTAIYLVFLHVLTYLFITLFVNIINKYMDALMKTIGGSDPSQIADAVQGLGSSPAMNTLVIAGQLTIIAIPMFFLLLQLPTIAQSMTAASAGSFGAGMTNVVRHVRSLVR